MKIRYSRTFYRSGAEWIPTNTNHHLITYMQLQLAAANGIGNHIYQYFSGFGKAGSFKENVYDSFIWDAVYIGAANVIDLGCFCEHVGVMVCKALSAWAAECIELRLLACLLSQECQPEEL